jgi:hypothetical protein
MARHKKKANTKIFPLEDTIPEKLSTFSSYSLHGLG